MMKDQLSKEQRRALSIKKKLHNHAQHLSNANIRNYAQYIKPVLRGNAEHIIFSTSAANQPLFWLPSLPIFSVSLSSKTPSPLCKAIGLTEAARIQTYHKYAGSPHLLRPTTYEAILQCPLEIIDQVCAFEFVAGHDDPIANFDNNLHMHVLTTIYYSGKLPREIARQDVIW